jgi:hypothetical protein
MAITALAMTATTASAQLEVHNETGGTDCGEVTIVGHDVTGGCHIDFVSPTGTNIPLHAYTPGKLTISNCEVALEGQVGENGEGYVTEAILTQPHDSPIPCTRTECDEVETPEIHHMIPWPFHIEEHGPGNEEVEATFCLRDITAEEHDLGVECEVHLEFEEEAGEHNYEIGHATNNEEFCENNPPNPTTHRTPQAPVSVEAHLISGGEGVEVIH